MDQISIDRIKLLHPKVRDEVRKGYDYVNKRLLGKGVRCRITRVYSTFKEQAELFAQGRTKGGKIVTRAREGESYHNYGLAFDFVILLDKNGDGHFEEVSWDINSDNDHDGIADWIEVANYFKSLGWKWGGDFKTFKDAPHLEKTFGYKAIDLLNKYNADDETAEVIGGKTYKWVNL